MICVVYHWGSINPNAVLKILYFQSLFSENDQYGKNSIQPFFPCI